MQLAVPTLPEWVGDEVDGDDADQVGLLEDLQVPIDAGRLHQVLAGPPVHPLRHHELEVGVAP
eukprot:12419030-Alexandrium_andersonii.AAC.1